MNAAAFAQTQLTPDQHQVLSAILKGASITAAAQSVAVHRTTLYHWCRTNQTFREALDNARRAYRASIQVQYEELATQALDTVKQVLDDPKASPSVRLKAALAILNQVHQPMVELPALTAPAPLPAPLPTNEPSNDEIFAEMARMEARLGMKLTSQPEATKANSTDSTPNTTPALTPERMSKRELQDEIDRLEAKCGVEPVKTIRYETPKPGRNEKCPCHSGIKYKKCCGK